jgi:hypothetical protein
VQRLYFCSKARTPVYDEFGFEESVAESVAPQPEAPHVPIREQFPEAGTDPLGGVSDGWEFRTIFKASKLSYSFEMLKIFLQEEGYGDVPIPESLEDLKLFRRPRAQQLKLFSENGYIHNPIKILFPEDSKQRGTLILCLYNEKTPNHLLRFHGVMKPV